MRRAAKSAQHRAAKAAFYVAQTAESAAVADTCGSWKGTAVADNYQWKATWGSWKGTAVAANYQWKEESWGSRNGNSSSHAWQ